MTTAKARVVAIYALVSVIGAAAFLYPFWLPSEAAPGDAHSTDAPLIAAAIGLLAVFAVALEVRVGTVTGAWVALLGVLSAIAGLLRLFDLPGGGSGIFFLVVLAGAAFGPRFGFLLGMAAMSVSALVTGGVGPWLPFQMLGLAWMGGGAGLVGRVTVHLASRVELAALVVYAWVWGFLYGAILNLWFWPFIIDEGNLAWNPGMTFAETAARYWSFYVVTSLGWDAAGALVNAVLVAIVGRRVLGTLRRFSHRLNPVVEIAPVPAPT